MLTTAYHFPVQGIEVAGPRLLAAAQVTPLGLDEERGAAAGELARRWNPALVLPIPDVWPVPVSYAWHDGSDLVARVPEQGGAPARSWVARSRTRLQQHDWGDLPLTTDDGRPVSYYLDAPGDDRQQGGVSRWRQRFREINRVAAGGDPRQSAYPPTQYAHVFWWNRDRGLLAIKYWFYYPFNEWVNHHEADWEHILVVLAGPSTLDDPARFTPAGYHYHFHDAWTELTTVPMVSGADHREGHPLVFVGGQGDWMGWRGEFSGGSYPWPGPYRRAGSSHRWLAADEQVGKRPLTRFIPADHFQVELLPEPHRLDRERRPDLGWLRLPLYLGQRTSHHNPPGYGALGLDHPPVQPGVRRSWIHPFRSPPYRDLPGRPAADALAEVLDPASARLLLSPDLALDSGAALSTAGLVP